MRCRALRGRGRPRGVSTSCPIRLLRGGPLPARALRSEPLLIPKLQSRFADFPWTRSPLTRGCPPRRPAAVLGTVAASARTVSGRRRAGAAAPCRARSRAEPFPGATAGHPGARSGCAGRRRGCCAGVAGLQAAGMGACVPFGACGALAVRLGPGNPGAAEGALETFSTSVVLRALSLLQPRSGPARGPGGPTAAVRAARCHALPGGSQRRVGRGL